VVVAGPLEVSGEGKGFEANMFYLVHPPGDTTARYDTGYTTVGYLDGLVPYRITIDLGDVPSGSTAVIHVESDSGIGQGGFSAIPVVVVDQIPATD
jgi:hypothetical protein